MAWVSSAHSLSAFAAYTSHEVVEPAHSGLVLGSLERGLMTLCGSDAALFVVGVAKLAGHVPDDRAGVVCYQLAYRPDGAPTISAGHV